MCWRVKPSARRQRSYLTTGRRSFLSFRLFVYLFFFLSPIFFFWQRVFLFFFFYVFFVYPFCCYYYDHRRCRLSVSLPLCLPPSFPFPLLFHLDTPACVCVCVYVRKHVQCLPLFFIRKGVAVGGGASTDVLFPSLFFFMGFRIRAAKNKQTNQSTKHVSRRQNWTLAQRRIGFRFSFSKAKKRDGKRAKRSI